MPFFPLLTWHAACGGSIHEEEGPSSRERVVALLHLGYLKKHVSQGGASSEKEINNWHSEGFYPKNTALAIFTDWTQWRCQ